jgi:hypothetical protein
MQEQLASSTDELWKRVETKINGGKARSGKAKSDRDCGQLKP